MSSVLTYFLLWIVVIYKMECTIVQLDPSRNAIEYLLQKYYSPLRKLSANLPNHAIELEIEVRGSIPTKTPPRRFIRLKKPPNQKPAWRAVEEAPESPPDPMTGPESAQITLGPPPAVSETDPLGPSKIPVFMEDLKKALNELEVKLATNTMYTMTTPGTNAYAPPASPTYASPQTYNNPQNPGNDGGSPIRLLKGPGAQNIDAIVEMLKKAVQIERREPKPGDDKMEWVQLKIPKTIQY